MILPFIMTSALSGLDLTIKVPRLVSRAQFTNCGKAELIFHETVLDAKNYHWYLPPVAMRGDWENHPSIDLTPGEAKWFIDKVTEELSDTMFAFAITQREKVATLNDFSELEKLNLPAHLKAQWELAQNFSNFIKAAQTRFNYLIGNKQAKEKWDAYPGQLSGLAESVDLNGIFDVLQLKSEQIGRASCRERVFNTV